MKLTKCSNGHYYNSEKYSVCPHCSSPHLYLKENMDSEIIKGEKMESGMIRKTGSQLVETEVKNVYVYLQGAVVCRQGRVRLKNGRNTVYISGISKSAVEESVRLNPEGEIKIEMIQVLDRIPKTETEEELPYDTEIKDLLGQEKKTQQRIHDIELMKEVWLENARNLMKGSADLSQAVAFIESLPEKISGLNEETEKLKEKLSMIQGEAVLKTKQQEAEEDRYALPCVMAQIWSDQDGDCDFTLEYMEKRANWKPFYEIKGNEAGAPVTIRLKGSVMQNTDEDWKNIRLKLSTGKPGSFQEKPDLEPILLDYRKTKYSDYGSERDFSVAIPVHFPPSIQSKDDPFEDNEHTVDYFQDEIKMPDVSSESNMLVTEYDLNGPWDIPHGLNETAFELKESNMAADYVYYAYPGYNNGAFLYAEINSNERTDMISAVAKVFFGQSYIGEYRINPSKWRESPLVPFGVEHRISVSKEKIMKSRSALMLGGKERQTYEYDIVVTNYMNNTISLHIEDQIPVSANVEITVEPMELSGGKLKEDTGNVVWRPSLKAGETVRFPVRYQVTFTKGKTLII